MGKQEMETISQVAKVEPTYLGEKKKDLKYVQNYLCRFGYLQENDYEKNVLDEHTSEALSTYQKFNAIPETGMFTEETRNRMTQARCGVPDIGTGLDFQAMCPWEKSELTYAFDIGTNDIRENTEFEAVRNAFNTWEEATPLTFKEVLVKENPDILIGWRRADDHDHSMIGGTLAHADFPPGCSIITKSLPLPIHFDDSEHTWSIGATSNAYDVETVALHEIGHILGLAHSDVEEAVMFPSARSNSTKRTLTPDDIAGIERLYRSN